MTGQKRLQDIFKMLIHNSDFPRFCILTGQVGSGKKTMCDWIVDEFRKCNPSITSYKLPDVKIDTIREMIATSYRAVNPIIYIIADADTMSVQAKNSLLKITEEPPNNAYFVMTLESTEMTLETVKSRASIFQLDPYTSDEIRAYSKRLGVSKADELGMICDICDVPGDVEHMLIYGVKDFYGYVNKVIDNIDTADGANVFKASVKLALRDEDGYDVKLFLRAFMAVCAERMKKEEPLKYATGTSITSKYMSQLGIRGVSKSMLIDAWIIEMRRYWTR